MAIVSGHSLLSTGPGDAFPSLTMRTVPGVMRRARFHRLASKDAFNPQHDPMTGCSCHPASQVGTLRRSLGDLPRFGWYLAASPGLSSYAKTTML